MGLKESVKHLLRMCGHAMVSTIHDRLNAIEYELKEIASSQTALLQSNIHILETLPQLRQAIYVDPSDAAPANAETALMSFLYSFLGTRGAVDVGAQTGEVAERLLKTGYEVYAIEPHALSYGTLCSRLKTYPSFRALDIQLNGVHTLADLHREGTVPSDVSLVRISAQGHELAIIRGMKEHRYPVVAADFRKSQAASPAGGGMGPLIAEMRTRGYAWFAVLYRTGGQELVSYFCNQDIPVPRSWGKVFFFRDRELFSQAQEWCASALPRTYFKPSSR